MVHSWLRSIRFVSDLTILSVEFSVAVYTEVLKHLTFSYEFVFRQLARNYHIQSLFSCCQFVSMQREGENISFLLFDSVDSSLEKFNSRPTFFVKINSESFTSFEIYRILQKSRSKFSYLLPSIFNYWLNLTELYLCKNVFYHLIVALIILSICIFLFSTWSHKLVSFEFSSCINKGCVFFFFENLNSQTSNLTFRSF